MMGEITEVRTSAARSAEAAKSLVEAAEKLVAQIARQEGRILDIDAKYDRLSWLEHELAELERKIAAKRQDLATAEDAYVRFRASLPA